MAVYQVTVGGKEYHVEIEDLNTQPVQAVVNGQTVEVWVKERELGPSLLPGPAAAPAPSLPPPAPTLVAVQPDISQEPGLQASMVRAPMPGTIIGIAVQPGDQVEIGQDMCVLEAMKMKNRIRAPRAGVIDQVHVSPGQQVQQGEVLVTFTQ